MARVRIAVVEEKHEAKPDHCLELVFCATFSADTELGGRNDIRPIKTPFH